MTRRARGRATTVAALALVLLLSHAPAAGAQTKPSTTPSPVAGKQIEVALGASFLTPVGMGAQPIGLQTSTGGVYPIAQTSNRTGGSLGLQAQVGFRLTDRLRVVVGAAWSRVRFQSRITGDVEGAPAITATSPVSRFTAGGDLVLPFRRSGSRQLFALAGVNWLRESSSLSAGALYKDGSLIDTGLGMKLWLRERAQGKIKRLGVQIEGRVGIRTGGVTLDTKSTHIAPAFLASVIIGT